MTRLKFTILLILIIFQNYIKTNGQTASAKLNKYNITVGDQINLTIEINCPADYNVTFPTPGDTITKNIEIVKRSDIKTEISPDQKQKTLQQTLYITTFDSGYFVIKPFRILLTKGKDTTRQYIETQALSFTAKTLPVDMQKGIRDIKPPMKAPFTFTEALPYILAFILLIAIILFTVYYLKKRKKKEPVFRMPSKPKLPPHELALAALEDLRNKKLWQNNKVKEFHTELTEIIRKYIEDRFSIPALEMISDDIIETIKNINISDEIKKELKEMLTLADLVKFAKQNPLPSEHDRSFNNALDFIKNTIITINQNDIKESN
jgi:hypothetical protein